MSSSLKPLSSISNIFTGGLLSRCSDILTAPSKSKLFDIQL